MVILYARTSTDEQTNGMESQVAQLEAEAAKRGWEDIAVIREHASGKSLARRPLLKDVLVQLDASGGLLVTTKIDRLSRSMLDYASLLERSRKKGWAIISLDLNLDTSTAVGQCMAHVVVAFAQMERQLISERTKAGLAIVKARGVELGHKSIVPRATKERIAQLREAKVSWRNITKILNAEKITAPGGRGVWHTTSVVRIAKS